MLVKTLLIFQSIGSEAKHQYRTPTCYNKLELEDVSKDKKQIYAEAEILEYWVVNLKDSELIVFRD